MQEVKPDSFGDTCGLSRGDVILEINKQPVNGEDDFNRKSSRRQRAGRTWCSSCVRAAAATIRPSSKAEPCRSPAGAVLL